MSAIDGVGSDLATGRFAMKPDSGMPGAEAVASPSTWIPRTARDSKLWKFTPTQRAAVCTKPAWRAI